MNRANLQRIKRFILERGERCTYCQMFNNNPCFATRNYRFFLIRIREVPTTTRSGNINCELERSDFRTLVVSRSIAAPPSRLTFDTPGRSNSPELAVTPSPSRRSGS